MTTMSQNTFNDESLHVGVMLLSVIIVNYNGLSFLETCLNALSRNISCRHEIIVVDNNSSDGSSEYLVEVWPEVRLIRSPENLGFAKGNNLGAKHARGRFLLLLNNDTEILEPLQPLLDYFEAHPDTAVVGGRLRNPDGSIQASVGYDHTPLRLLFTWMLLRTCSWFSSWQIYERRPKFYQHTHREVHWVSGAFLCIRKRIWLELAGFDPDIFMYVEDADLCSRVRKRGEKIAFFAGADTCHFEGSGKKGMTGNALMATVDSYRLLLAKQHSRLLRNLTCGGLALIFFARAMLYLLLGMMLRDPVSKGKAGFYMRGAGRLLWGAPQNVPVRSKRGEMQ
ncbi:MAG: glycosyltransferase family 2 protein [Pseudomonadota bacterium]